MEVLILKSDKRLGIKAGEVYNSYPYHFDRNKIVLDSRIPDGYDPSCAQYKDEVATKIKGTWCKVINNTYVTMDKSEVDTVLKKKLDSGA